MKKIIALILTFLIAIGCIVPFNAFAQSDENIPDCRTEVGLLTSLGIFSDSEVKDDLLSNKVTRGDFATKLAALLQMQTDSKDNVYFYDSKDLPEVNLLAAAGIFKGNSDGYFYPNNNITRQEAAVALVRALGYESYIAVKGGDVALYVRQASKLGVISDKNPSEELTLRDMVTSFYNTLLADAYEIESISDKGIKYSDDGDNLLWLIYNMVCIEGSVTEDAFTGLYGDSNIAWDCIGINDVIYKTTISNPWEYIGRNVTAFAKDDNGSKTVVCMVSDEESNETIILNAGDFTYKDHVIEYYDESDKARKVTLTNSVSVIKNHQAVSGDFEEAFDIKVGTVKLYKNEYISNGYSVALIESAETALVELADFAENVVYTSKENIKKINTTGDETNYVEMVIEPSGNRVGTTQLKRGNVLEIYRSADGTYTKIHVCADSVKGSISNILTSGTETTVTIGGSQYDVSALFVGTPEFTVGMMAEFFFDTQGKILYYNVQEKKSGVLFAYLYDATKTDGAFDNTYKLKLYDENGLHSVTELAEKVTFDGAKLTAQQVYERLINDSTGKLKRQLLMYNTNKDGKISYLDTAASASDVREAEGTLWEVANVGSYRYCNTQRMFYPTYPLRSDRTKVFVIPKETNTSPTERNFSVMTFNGSVPFNVETNYNVGFYKNSSTEPYMDVVLYELEDIPTDNTFKSVMAIEHINTVYDKVGGNVYVNADCYISSYKSNVNFADEVVLTPVEGGATTIAAEKLSSYIGEGDIVQYSQNATGEIVRVTVIYDYDQDKMSWGDAYSNYASASSKYPTDGLILADVSDVYRNTASNNSQALITLGYKGVDKEYISLMPSQFNALVYDSGLKENRFYTGDLSDLISLKSTSGTECSKLFIQRTSMYYTTFIIYK